MTDDSNHMDRYVSLRFQGLKSSSISADMIAVHNEEELTYLVSSKTQHGVVYLVDMKHGLCSCA